MNKMKLDDFLAQLNAKFPGKVLRSYKHNPKRAYVDIDPKDIRAFTAYIFKDEGLRFHIASAVDTFDGMEILYHFTHDPSDFIISVRVLLKDRDKPSIETITDITSAAWWIEREMHELFGIGFEGNKDLRRLLLPDDWPDGVYPLKKDFIVPKRDSRDNVHKPHAEGGPK